VTAREGAVLGVALDGRYTPYNGPSTVVEPKNWMSVLS
jgi:hypothetical protein